MSQKTEEDVTPAVPRTHGVRPRCIQTSGIFRIPAELIAEILIYFGDPHRNILLEKGDKESGLHLHAGEVERSTVIRKLTMTCWHLRNMLLPLLWEYVEGCNILCRGPARRLKNGLYAQCTYLILNPTIGTYVRTLSVDLDAHHFPKDLMTKFFDCLVLLPNLKTLEIFSTSHDGMFLEVKGRSTQFPSVRELVGGERAMEFLWRCPNVERLTIRGTPRDNALPASHGENLKQLRRIAGVREGVVGTVVRCFPDLREICIKDETATFNLPCPAVEVIEHLRSLEHLAVVEISLDARLSLSDRSVETEYAFRQGLIQTNLNTWKKHLIQLLRDSPSKERKFVRWDVPVLYLAQHLGTGELEVLPERPL